MEDQIAQQAAQLKLGVQIPLQKRVNKIREDIENSPLGQGIKGYFDDHHPENPDQAYQVGQAAAYSPSPLAAGAGVVRVLPKIGRAFDKLGRPIKEMAKNQFTHIKPEDGDLIGHTVEDMIFKAEQPDYQIFNKAEDEEYLREMARKYVNKNFAEKASTQDIAQELINRIKAETGAPSVPLPQLESHRPVMNY